MYRRLVVFVIRTRSRMAFLPVTTKGLNRNGATDDLGTLPCRYTISLNSLPRAYFRHNDHQDVATCRWVHFES